MNRDYFRDFYYKTITPKVLEGLKKYGPYDRTLFIECDNGELIEFIESNEIHGIDSSNIQSVPIVKRIDTPDRVYDLIVLSEKDYATYSKEKVYEWITKSAARIIAVIGSQQYMSEFNFGGIKESIVLCYATDLKLKIYQFEECFRVYE